jgi:hypothetical protein
MAHAKGAICAVSRGAVLLSRTLGEVTAAGGYNALIAIFRARFDEIGITGETSDYIGGLAAGHTTKLLTANHLKKFGPVTLGPILGVLGMKLIAVVDEEVLAQIRNRHTPAKFRRWHTTSGMLPRKRAKKTYNFSDRDFALAASRRATVVMTATQRRRRAKHAAAVRWGLITPERYVQELTRLAKPKR